MTFNEINISRFDAVLLSKGERQKAKENYIEYGPVPGSNLVLYEATGTYAPYERQVQILSRDARELSAIYAWLDGSGNLDLNDGGYYKVRVLATESITESFVQGWTRIVITFEVEPFLFLHTPTVILESGQTVYNPGVTTDPYFRISGSGPVTVSINGESFTVNIDQYVEIEYPFAWKGILNKGRDLSAFPKVGPGKNVITWTGSVYEVQFNGRWRTF